MADAILAQSGALGSESHKPLEQVFPLREDLDLYPGTPLANGVPTWVLHDRIRNRFFNIGWLQYEMLRRWPARHPDRIVEQVLDETPLSIDRRDVEYFHQFLLLNELSAVRDGSQSGKFSEKVEQRTQGRLTGLLHHYLFVRIPLVMPDRFLGNTLWLVRLFFTKSFWVLLGVLALFGMALVIRQWSEFSTTFANALSFEGLVFFFVALSLSKCLHEFGHAYTSKYYGLQVPTMGLALLIMWPFLYTDTSESWKLGSRRQRIVIGSAGVIAELILAVVALLVWTILPEGPVRSACFYLATGAWVATLAINISPFLQWDGYHVLSDLLGIPNLRARGFAMGQWKLREWLFGFGDSPPEPASQRLQRILLWYAYPTWIYRFVLFLGVALLVYYFFFKVLGIFLMLVELYWFIVRPIFEEVKEWLKRKGAMRWNVHSVTTVLLLVGIVLLLVVPWQGTIRAEGVLTPRLHKTLFPPIPAKIVTASLDQNDPVVEGQELFRLRSPDLEIDVALAKNRIVIYQKSLQREGRQDLLESRAVVQQQLQEAVTAYRGYQQQRDRLVIRAPFSGEVSMVSERVRPDQWVGEDQSLATIVDKGTVEVRAYLLEHEITRVKQDQPGMFYPEDPALDAVSVTITEIDPASTIQLSDPVLAVQHGGNIETVTGEGGILQPTQALYRIRFSIDAKDTSHFPLVTRGTVHLPGESQSLMGRVWKNMVAVGIRESGF